MRKLEDQTNELIDDDSILAPLTQATTKFSSQSSSNRLSQRLVASQLNKSTIENSVVDNNSADHKTNEEENYFHDSDDDLLNDFSLCLNDDEFR